MVPPGLTFKIHHCISPSYKESPTSVEDKVILGVIVTIETFSVHLGHD